MQFFLIWASEAEHVQNKGGAKADKQLRLRMEL